MPIEMTLIVQYSGKMTQSEYSSLQRGHYQKKEYNAKMTVPEYSAVQFDRTIAECKTV